MKEGWRVVGVASLAVIAITGCDQLPWGQTHATPQNTQHAQQTTSSATGGAGQPNVPVHDRVATVNQVSISTTDVELAVRELKQLAQAYNQEWKPLSDKNNPDALDLHDVMENIEVLELKAQDARARGLDHKTDVQRRLAYLERGFFAQEWDRSQQELLTPTEEEIHKFYETYKQGFVDPERVQLRQIVTNTLAEAEAVRAKAVQGSVFQQLAMEYSVGPGKDNGGNAGWFLKQEGKNLLTQLGVQTTESVLFPQLEPVAFALDKDQVSQPVKGPDGKYYLVQLMDRKLAKQRTELEVHDGIKQTLVLQKMQQQVEQLRKKAKIEEFSERLGAVQQ